jgi:hypothetical protein
MIISKITGGLGNQMFQYSIAKAVALKNNDHFKLDLFFYPTQDLRKYELSLFNIEENIISNEELQNIVGSHSIFSKIYKIFGLNKTYFIEKEIVAFDSNVFNNAKNKYLIGYWQNEKYFKDIRSEILNCFKSKDKISFEANYYLKRIKNSNSVALHVRRGDYIQDRHTNSVHGVCNLDYYNRAISYINSKVSNPVYFIFSDDMPWCKENIHHLGDIIFVDNTSNSIDDLELMKSCKHNIIANSTFSWWGGWLNNYKSKIVIAPKIWFLKSPDKNPACREWIKL